MNEERKNTCTVNGCLMEHFECCLFKSNGFSLLSLTLIFTFRFLWPRWSFSSLFVEAQALEEEEEKEKKRSLSISYKTRPIDRVIGSHTVTTTMMTMMMVTVRYAFYWMNRISSAYSRTRARTHTVKIALLNILSCVSSFFLSFPCHCCWMDLYLLSRARVHMLHFPCILFCFHISNHIEFVCIYL